MIACTKAALDWCRQCFRLAGVAVIAVLLGLQPAVAHGCVGDCNGDGMVEVTDLITGVNIALGLQPVTACEVFANEGGKVDIAQLIQGVNNALNGCAGSPTITLTGSCAAPGSGHSLKPCDAETPITVFRCDDRTQCLHQQGLTMVGATTVASGGGWSVQVPVADVSAALIFQASITKAVVYRTLGFGTVGSSLRAGLAHDVTFAPVAITPVTEAAVQLLDSNAFENYSDTGAQEVVTAVEQATANLSFDGLTPDAAAALALNTASADPTVMMVLKTARNNTTLYDDFEGPDFYDHWAVDNGTWQWGVPSSGPGAAHQGDKVVATVLDGNYVDGTSSRLERLTKFVVPDPAEHPRLRFWHWFNFACGDSGQVQIKAGTADWQTLATFSGYSGGTWSYPSLDLSAYSGQTVQVGFYFSSSSPIGCGNSVAPGWYIDELLVTTAAVPPLVPNVVEGFEEPNFWDNWSADNGTWEWGVPTSGPTQAYDGSALSNVIATVLDGNYGDGTSSLLVSPTFVVPDAAQSPLLRFWHWFNFACGDSGHVQIQAAGGTWQTLATFSGNSGGTWSYPALDLSAYSGQTVHVGFYFSSSSPIGCGNSVAPGWYIDDLVVKTG